MLILTRKLRETIVIGDNVRVTILANKGNQVRIGIDAPKNITVHREEIYERIQAEVNNQIDYTEDTISINANNNDYDN